MSQQISVKFNNKLLSELTTEIPQTGIIAVGTDSSATIRLTESQIAPEQFVLICEPEQIILMSRTDGTFINGAEAKTGSIHNFQTGDIIKTGSYTFQITDEKFDLTETNISHHIDDLSVEKKDFADTDNRIELTLTDYLQTLKSDEKFYFQTKSVNGTTQNFFIEKEESFFGKNSGDQLILSDDINELKTVFAKIVKDWEGVILTPQPKSEIKIENNRINNPHRLKNDNEIFFNFPNNGSSSVVKFHEPSSLQVLRSILPQSLPPPVSLDNSQTDRIEDSRETKIEQGSPGEVITSTKQKKLFFGYFSIIEVVVMIIGTLITAGLIFLILELY